jgi:hypothetical protein
VAFALAPLPSIRHGSTEWAAQKGAFLGTQLAGALGLFGGLLLPTLFYIVTLSTLSRVTKGPGPSRVASLSFLRERPG